MAKRNAVFQRQKHQLKAAKKLRKLVMPCRSLSPCALLGIIFWVGFAQCLAPRAAELAHRTVWRVFALGTVGFV